MSTNQLPPHTITIRDHPEPHIMQWSDLELAAVKRYAEQYALQARAQVHGEAFGYIHHFAAHDERGVLIDTTWEADGCADPLPHPTFPSMWKWTHCTPFYTTPQLARSTGEPVLFIHPDTFAMNNSHVGAWKPGHELPGYIPLFTHPAPSVLKDDQIAALVNKVRDIARMFHDHQSLRERIAIELVPVLKALNK